MFSKEKYAQKLEEVCDLKESKDPEEIKNQEEIKKTIQNVVNIAAILSKISNVTEEKDINTALIYLLYKKPLRKQKKSLDEFFSSPYSATISEALLQMLENPNYKALVEENLKFFQPSKPEDSGKFFMAVKVLLEFYMADMTNFEEKYLRDFIAISNFLADKAQFEKNLNFLEGELQDHAKSKNATLVAQESGLWKLPNPPTEKPYHRQKILSSFLYKWAQEKKFNQEFYAKAIGNISETEFLKLLREKIVIKDEVTKSHGKWPHIIQWYCVIEENIKSKFLENDPLELYAYLGTDNAVAKKKIYDLEFGPDKKNAWDIIFDRPDRAFDYRSPEYTTSTLIANRNRWPILGESIERESNKPLQKKEEEYNKPKSQKKEDLIIYKPYKS